MPDYILADAILNMFIPGHFQYSMLMAIIIFWDPSAPEGLAGPVSRRISSITGEETTYCESPVTLNGYVGHRRQYDAALILDTLATYVRRNGINEPILLVVGKDLFIDGHDCVFGLARPQSRVGVVSGARLGNEYYNRQREDEDLIDRVARECTHELGHILGLSHCTDHECIMYNPHTLDDLDGKKNEFCQHCRDKLGL